MNSDPLAASVGTQGKSQNQLDPVDDANKNSLLAVADDLGHIHCFLDGCYPLGPILLAPPSSVSSLFKHPRRLSFFAHPRMPTTDTFLTDLFPITVRLPLLDQRNVRDLAKLSSTARELIWYAMRVVKEMRTIWFGSETLSGARELGPKWTQALEMKQRDQFGRKLFLPWLNFIFIDAFLIPDREPNPILDLTHLLVTGRASDALADYLGSAEQMSERVSLTPFCQFSAYTGIRVFKSGNPLLGKL